MKKLAVSIVLFSPDNQLLIDVIKALRNACMELSATGEWAFALDLVNNNPNEEHREPIEQIAYALSTPQFLIQLVEAGFNGGYGAGNNISIKRHLDVNYHLVLNPDVLVSESSLSNAVNYMTNNTQVGLLTPKVKGFDGEMQYLCKLNPTLLDMIIRSVRSPLLNIIFKERNQRFEMRDHDYEQIICPVPYPTGCFMLFRRSVLDSIKGFDEKFFLHYEDADIGRMTNNVSLVSYVPSVVVFHKWSRDSHKSWRMRWITIRSGLRYFFKWGGIYRQERTLI